MFTCKQCESTKPPKHPKRKETCIECVKATERAYQKKRHIRRKAEHKGNDADKLSRARKSKSIIMQDVTEIGARECALLSAKWLSVRL